MQFDAELNLLEAAVRLRGEAPSIYENFTAAMRAYAGHVLGGTLRASPDALQRAQGMAIAANEIAQILSAAPAMLEQRRSRNGPRAKPTAYPPGATLPG